MTNRGASVYLQSPQMATIVRQSWTEVLCFKNLKKTEHILILISLLCCYLQLAELFICFDKYARMI